MTGADDRLAWRHVAACALLWGLGATLADALTQPVGDLTVDEFTVFVPRVAVPWITSGFVWAGGLKLAEESQRPLMCLPAVMILAWCASMLVQTLLFEHVRSRSGGMTGLLMHIPLFDMAAYLLWGNLFYGGLYSFGFLATRRAARMRRRLAALRLTRNQADTRLREARLKAVRGQIQPAVLLDALSALQTRYAEDVDAGNRLFDQIVDFLRAAMPGLRSGDSTIGAELGVLRAYADLLDGLDAGRPNWRLTVADVPIDIPFPPMRLLPVLDQISKAAPPGSTIEVKAATSEGSYIVSIGADPPLPRETAGPLQAVIRRSLGGGGVGAADALRGLIAKVQLPMDGRRSPMPVVI